MSKPPDTNIVRIAVPCNYKLPPSYDKVMVVAVGPESWKEILETFRYFCPINDGIHHRRINSKYLAFYRTGNPQAITHWAELLDVGRVLGGKESNFCDEFWDDTDKIIYSIESLHKLGRPIVKGKVPPQFAGGCVVIPFKQLEHLYTLDEVLELRVVEGEKIPTESIVKAHSFVHNILCDYYETDGYGVYRGENKVRATVRGEPSNLLNFKKGFDILFSYYGKEEQEAMKILRKKLNKIFVMTDEKFNAFVQPGAFYGTLGAEPAMVKVIFRKVFFEVLTKELSDEMRKNVLEEIIKTMVFMPFEQPAVISK